MDPADRVRVEKGLLALGITAEDFNEVRRQRTYEEAVAKLEEVKEKVRKGYKKLAFELHPDRTGDDVEKTELFKIITQVKQDIESLQIERPRPVPVPVPMIPVVMVQFGGIGRPPPGHPAAQGGVRQWGSGSVTTVMFYPTGVQVPRGPRR